MAVLVAAVDCFSADITTLDGKTYKDARVTGIEADGVHISFREGVVKVPFDQLPQELQRQYGYDPAKTTELHNAIAVKLAGTVKRVAGQMLANFPQSVAKNPMPIALLVGFVLVLTIRREHGLRAGNANSGWLLAGMNIVSRMTGSECER